MKKAMLVLGLVSLVAIASRVSAQDVCGRACLTGFVDGYFQALAAGNARGFALARNAKITLNGRQMGLDDTFWEGAGETIYRWDIVNERLGDTGTEAIVRNDDGSKTMLMLRLKVHERAVTEVEIIRANEGDAGALWGPDQLTEVSPFLTLTIREADRDSYYRPLLPDSQRFENGLQTTGLVRDGRYVSTSEGFDQGRFATRNLWDRRYPVVDTERGIVLSIVRFGTKDGMASQSAVTTNDRIVAEFFAVKSGMIQEVHAVLFNLPDAEPTGWEPDYGPPRGGW
jgi:hypothetical protein